MSFMMMLSRGVLSYFSFRLTRGIISGGLDKASNVVSKLKVSTCNECGKVYGGEILVCPYCDCATEKLYKEYIEDIVDSNLKLTA